VFSYQIMLATPLTRPPPWAPLARESLGVAHVSRGRSVLSPHIDGEQATIAERVARMALTGVDQDCRRDAANIAGVKALRDDDADVFEAILRCLVRIEGTDENVVTVAAVARTEGA
jgi:hypothetical protein